VLLKLDGKRALVTGASSGIGAATAMLLASENVKVVVHGRDAARAQKIVDQIRGSGGVAEAVLGDISTTEGAVAVAQAADEAFGGIDILINNAGGPSDPALGLGIFDLDADHWVKTYERNVVSCLNLARHLSKQMVERGWGRIIQVTSGLSFNPLGLQGDYAASKAALNNFTFNLSRSLKNTGVTVNGVSPGMTVTPMLEQWLADVAAEAGQERDPRVGEKIVLENMVSLTVNRLGLPEDLANAITFLASPLADYINGTTLRVDGGGSAAVH
jgi:NAD(P)-dependent dehydrogenase (short-subunit alcohol dehydrogenase family)